MEKRRKPELLIPCGSFSLHTLLPGESQLGLPPVFGPAGEKFFSGEESAPVIFIAGEKHLLRVPVFPFQPGRFGRAAVGRAGEKTLRFPPHQGREGVALGEDEIQVMQDSLFQRPGRDRVRGAVRFPVPAAGAAGKRVLRAAVCVFPAGPHHGTSAVGAEQKSGKKMRFGGGGDIGRAHAAF